MEQSNVITFIISQKFALRARDIQHVEFLKIRVLLAKRSDVMTAVDSPDDLLHRKGSKRSDALRRTPGPRPLQGHRSFCLQSNATL